MGPAEQCQSERSNVLLVCSVLLLAFALRLYLLGALTLGFDESVSTFIARLGHWEEVVYLARWDAHPPLLYWLLHHLLPLAAGNEFVLRFPFAAAAFLSVVLVYRLGVQLGSHRIGLASALMAAMNPALVAQAREARMYPLAEMLMVLATSLLVAAWRRPRRRYWVGYALSMLLALYLLYWPGFVVLFHLLFLGAAFALRSLAPERGRGRLSFLPVRSLLPGPGIGFLRGYLLAFAAIVVLYLPWLPFLARQTGQTGASAWREYVPALDMLLRSVWAMLLGESISRAMPAMFWLPVAAGLILALSALAASPRTSAILLGRLAFSLPAMFALAYLAVPLLAMGVLSLTVRPLFAERYVIVFYPPLALLVGGGAVRLWERRRMVTAALVVTLLAGQGCGLLRIYEDGRHPENRGYPRAAQTIQRDWRPDDVVIFTSSHTYLAMSPFLSRPIAWRGPLQTFEASVVAEARRSQPGDLVVVQVGTIGEELGPPMTTPEDYPTTRAEAERRLAAIAQGSQRVWVFKDVATRADPDDVVMNMMLRHGVKVREQWFSGTSFPQLYLFLSRLPTSMLGQLESSMEIGWPVGGLLRGYTLDPAQVVPGRPFAVRLYWQPRPALLPGYHLSLRLLDTRGRVVAQHDNLPLDGQWPADDKAPAADLLPDEHQLALPADTESGAYYLRARLYQAADLRPVDSLADAADITLGSILIAPEQAQSPAMSVEIGKTLGATIELAASRITEDSVKPEGTVSVSLHWHALGRPERDYTVFVQAIGPDSRVWAQQDGFPVSGRFPTSTWRPGLLLADGYRLTIPATAPAGRYTLIAGMYYWQTGERLPVQGGGDSVVLGSVVVRP